METENPIAEATHMLFGRHRLKAERSATLALKLMAAAPKARGPLVAYVAAAALADELTLKEARIRKALA